MPNRILKESICYSESIRPLSWFEEVFFYRLIVNADDFGRLDGRPEMLQAKLFPLRRELTESTVKKALNALTAAGMVQVYEYDQKLFLQLTAWEQHQQVRAKKSKFPAPDINGNQLISNVPVILSENPKREARSDTCASAPQTQTLKKFTKPTLEEVQGYCLERGNLVDAARFIDHYTSNGWKVGKNAMKDWKAAVRTWEKGETLRAKAPNDSQKPNYDEDWG